MLVGVVEAEVGRDYPDARLFQPLGDLLQVGGVDAGHLERIDPFGSWCRVEKPAEATAVRRPIVDVSDDLASGGEGDAFPLGPLGLDLSVVSRSPGRCRERLSFTGPGQQGLGASLRPLGLHSYATYRELVSASTGQQHEAYGSKPQHLDARPDADEHQ